MTKEKSIEIIQELWRYKETDKYIETEIRQALDMAIEALAQKSCEDAISREAVIDGISKYFHDEYYQRTSIQDCRDCLIEDVITKLPSVTPQPKTGHWIEHPHETGENWEYSKYECSECHVWEEDDSDYCPNCGARMEIRR